VLEHSDQFDSAFQVAEACSTGQIESEQWDEWIDIKDSFEPNTVSTWISDHAIRAAERWGSSPDNRGGVIWCEFTAFAQRLKARTRWGYYGKQGNEVSTGLYIEDAPRGETIIASLKANCEGRNLQYSRNRNLFTIPMNGNIEWEQTLGRTHRPGQIKSEVSADYFLGCYEHHRAIHQAYLEAEAEEQTMGKPQKLTLADLTLSRLDTRHNGHAWQPTATEK
jgi:hypothetical protein